MCGRCCLSSKCWYWVLKVRPAFRHGSHVEGRGIREVVPVWDTQKQLRAEAESPAGYASIYSAATPEETNKFRTTISLCSVYCCGVRSSSFANELDLACNYFRFIQ